MTRAPALLIDMLICIRLVRKTKLFASGRDANTFCPIQVVTSKLCFMDCVVSTRSPPTWSHLNAAAVADHTLSVSGILL